MIKNTYMYTNLRLCCAQLDQATEMAWSICADDNKQTFVQKIIINHLHDERWQKTVFRTTRNLRVGPLVHNTIQLCVFKTAGIKLALLYTVALLAKNCCFNCHVTVLPNNALCNN